MSETEVVMFVENKPKKCYCNYYHGLLYSEVGISVTITANATAATLDNTDDSKAVFEIVLSLDQMPCKLTEKYTFTRKTEAS